MRRIKFAILAGLAAITIGAGVPAEGAGKSGDMATATGWSGSGWETSGTARAPAVQAEETGSLTPSIRGGTQVPEPSNLMMLVLGLAGLVAGRMFARRRKKL